MSKTIMIVDDEKQIRDTLGGVLTDEGYRVVAVEDGEEALKRFSDGGAECVLLDIWLPGMDGIEVLKEFKKRYPEVPVIMISGHGNVETAVKATKLGAYDFLEKPLSLEKVLLTVEHALEQKRLAEENREFLERARREYAIIGNSPVMKQLKEDIKRVATTNSWVLITGENGTGKELVARNIHLYSKRSGKPFVAVNCAAIPDELIESELFGYEKGAFTGASGSKKGKFDLADGGTIFLDEIGDMSLKTQAKILRILQERSFERVGGTKTITVDVRVIAATNKDLEEEMKKGNFREDLYYRLNVIPFHVPPLRERKEDIPLFVKHYIKEFSLATAREDVPHLTDAAMSALVHYHWPGNVRELKNLMERLVIMVRSSTITVEDLPPYIREHLPDNIEETNPFRSETLREARKHFEKEFIKRKLREYNWNISRTADAIGIERSHLYRKMKSYGIEVDK